MSDPQCTLALAAALLVTAAGSQGHPSSTHQSVAFWIPNAAANSILGYTVTADGNVPPSRTIAGDLTGLDAPSAITTDADGTLYVANAGNNSVTIYAPDADGNAPPLRTLRGPSTGLAGPQGIAVDAAQAIYVANTSRGRVTVYPPGARGDVWPVRSIWGSRTGLGLVHGIAVDRHGAVYVASQYLGRISVFSANADGNVRPARVIKGLWDHPAGDPAYQHWEGLTEPWGLALGTDERIYATMIENAVMVFKRGAQGFALPERTIHGPRTGLHYPTAVTLDPSGFMAVLSLGQVERRVTVYDRRANGDVPPVRTMAGPLTGLRPTDSVLASRARPNARPSKLPPSIMVYPSGAADVTPPSRTIMGEHTLLATPVSVTLGRDRTLYVLSCQGRVTAYAPDADGDAPPTRTLGGALRPAMSSGLVVDGEGTVYASHNWGGHGGHGYVFVYPPGSSGDTTPTRIIRGFRDAFNGLVRGPGGLLYRGNDDAGIDVVDSRTSGEYPPILRLSGLESELFRPGSFAIDSSGRLYVPNGDDAVRVYADRSSGELRPLRTISGRHTELDLPLAAVLGPGDTLYVANGGTARGPSVTLYAPGAAGDAAPVRTLRGSRTALTAISALVVDSAGRLYVVNNPSGTEHCMPAGW